MKMKKLRYAWLIVRNLLVILVVFGVFAKADTEFETIVIVGLLNILLTLSGFMKIWGLTQYEFLGLLDSQRADIKRLLNEELDENEQEAIKKRNKQIEDDQEKGLINGVFEYIIYLITLFALLGALLD